MESEQPEKTVITDTNNEVEITVVPKKGGRPRKYKTAEDAEEARRQYAKKYYEANKEICIKRIMKSRNKKKELDKQEIIVN